MDFAITFDYLCPFARNTNEAVLDGVERGAGWRVAYRPFSLAQAHVADGDPPVWEQPDGKSGVLALQWGVAVRDHLPDAFPRAHRELFASRHDHGEDINDDDVLRRAMERAGLDPDPVAEIVASGKPLDAVAAEHADAVERHRVFGVPTIISDGEAVFVRMMERGRVDDLERVLDLISWGRLNEFKRTSIPR